MIFQAPDMRLFLFILGFLGSAFQDVYADDPGLDDPVLKAAIFDFAVWTEPAEDASGGIKARIIDALSAETGHSIETIVVPYPRMLRMVETGTVDFAIFFVSKKSREIADPLHVFYQIQTSIIVPDTVTEASSNRPRNIATARGVLLGDTFDNSKEFEKTETNGHIHSAQLLVQGRVDGVVGPEKQLLAILKSIDPLKSYRVLRTINVNRVTLQYSKRSENPSMKAVIAAAAQRLRDSGQLETLLSDFPYTHSENGHP